MIAFSLEFNELCSSSLLVNDYGILCIYVRKYYDKCQSQKNDEL